MKLRKLLWAARAVMYKITFGKMGNLSYIGKPNSIIGARRIFIDDKVRIQPGIRMETSNGGKIIIEKNCSIGQNVHITADTESLVIRENTTILGNSFITNIDHDYKTIGKHILEQKKMVTTTDIGENCFIGFGACIQAGTILGKQCVVGANSVVRGHYSDYCVIVGAPGHIVKHYNKESGEWEKIK